jgi:hypothetical protein
VVDALTAQGAGFNVLNAAFAGGADPAGAADSAAAWQAAMNALPASGGAVIVPPGTYKLASTVTNAVTPTYIVCPGGRWATTANYTGSGDCIRMLNTTAGGGGFWGGGVTGLYINGSAASAGACGLHIGDGEQYYLDVAVEHFNGAGSIGVHLDNTVWWTEKCHGTIFARDCTSHVVFDVTGATTSTSSFGYLDLTCYLYAQANQDGVVVQNGAYPYHGRLAIKGNFQGSASAVTNAVLRITGTIPAGHPGAGNRAQVTRCQLDIQAEVQTAANQPSTIIFGGSAGQNAILGCYGIMDFTQGTGTFTQTNLPAATNSNTFIYSGPVLGDVSLNPAGILPAAASIGPHVSGRSFINGSNGNTFPNSGDFFSATLAASITVNLNPSAAATIAAPQRKTIIIKQAAAGGPYTVTWPHTGSPTTSAPTVNWAGGTAPTMTATANAVDVYKLETYDGATWYGTASQNVS